MQRVAIARALVNDPEILLADEPTGALDSDTSLQVMDLLREVAKDRLVVMVTHNPELADAYATRIVTLRDGKILSDTDPFLPDGELSEEGRHETMGKASMSFLTALSLSFRNLQTKKARTLLTSFAGSIGIIGIALILSLSTGVNQYIQSVEEETLSEYPLQIQSTGFDFTSMLAGSTSVDPGKKSGEVNVVEMVTDMFSSMDSNDLASLKTYLDSGKSDIADYTNAVEYSYNTVPQIYRVEEDNVRRVNPDSSFSSLGLGSSVSSNSLMSSMMSTNVFYEMPENEKLYKSQYELCAGRWPSSHNECVLVLTSGGGISDFLLYTMGLRDSEDLGRMVQQFLNEETVEIPSGISSYSYDDFLNLSFRLVNSADYYVYDSEFNVWKDKSGDSAYLNDLVKNGEELNIVGVVQPSENAGGFILSPGINYPYSLTKHLAEEAETREIVQKQLQNPDINVFTGKPFGEESETTFDTASLFSVDADALQNLFSFDTNALSGSFDMADAFSQAGTSFQITGMPDLGSLTISLPELPALNLEELLSGLEWNLSPEILSQAASALLEGYQDYAASHPEADYTGLTDDFLAFIQSPEGSQIIADWSASVFPDGVSGSVTSKQLEELASRLTEGYREYAAANGLPDPGKMGEHFLAYLKTDQAREILSDALQDVVDVEELQNRLTGALQNSLQTVMASLVQSVASSLEQQITASMEQYMTQLAAAMERSIQQSISQLGNTLEQAFQIDGDAFSEAFDIKMDAAELSELMLSMNPDVGATAETNLQTLGYVDFGTPSSISIYPLDFESKEHVIQILDEYNRRMEDEGKEEQVISYTDLVGSLMSSVTDIIDTISYVLIAFVAISLIVSSIMIGVITYISVLERKKEIGILRAIGASRHNISQVFNAETFIIGLSAGAIGIGLTLLLLLPSNALIHYIAGRTDINAVLPPVSAVILILLSILLTLAGGLIPSRKAAKSDPVTALRTD